MALASPRASAHLIPLPGAAAAPVANPPRPRGRPSKKVTGIWRGKEIRYRREADAARQAVEAQVQQTQEQQAREARRKSPIRDKFCAAFAVAVNGLPLEDLKEVTELMISRMSPSLKREMHHA